MSGIFISYRREDSAGWTAQLSRVLRDAFGENQIFMDVIALKAGADFIAEVQRALAASDAAIVVIGPRWLSAIDTRGRRRLDNPKDPVRSEVAAALALRLPTIPVLVENAPMPSEKELPRNLKDLARLNAFDISAKRVDQDLDRLVTQLRQANYPGLGPSAVASVRIYYEGKWFLSDAYVDVYLDDIIIGTGSISARFSILSNLSIGTHRLKFLYSNSLLRKQQGWANKWFGLRDEITIHIPDAGSYQIRLDMSRPNKKWRVVEMRKH